MKFCYLLNKVLFRIFYFEVSIRVSKMSRGNFWRFLEIIVKKATFVEKDFAQGGKHS